MCLIVVGYQVDDDTTNYPFVVVANRDEYYDRPTTAARFWTTMTTQQQGDSGSGRRPRIFAGQDDQAGGTWMGVTTAGRFAAVTNYREEASTKDPGASSTSPFRRSRGSLAATFLELEDDAMSAEAYAEQVQSEGHLYDGFNLLVGDRQGLFCVSNRSRLRDGTFSTTRVDALMPGKFYGLCNHLLDHPWPKLCRLKHTVAHEMLRDPVGTTPASASAVLTERLLTLLQDTTRPPVAELPMQDTGCSIELETLLSSIFISSDASYGTRASTVILVAAAKDGTGTVVDAPICHYTERSFGREGVVLGTVQQSFEMEYAIGG